MKKVVMMAAVAFGGVLATPAVAHADTHAIHANRTECIFLQEAKKRGKKATLKGLRDMAKSFGDRADKVRLLAINEMGFFYGRISEDAAVVNNRDAASFEAIETAIKSSDAKK